MIRKSVAGKILQFEPPLPQLEMLDSFEACGGKIWPVSEILVKFLADNMEYTKNSNVLELGSGCGYVGISLAAMGHTKNITISDRLIKKSRTTYDMEGLPNEDLIQSPILLDILRRNVASNSPFLTTQPRVQELEWGPACESHIKGVLFAPEAPSYDLIVGSDLTYHSATASDLFWTVSRLMKEMTERRNQERKKQCEEGTSIHREVDVECCEGSPAEVKFITAHEHRLDVSTQITLDVAINKFHLKHKEIYTSPDWKHSVWMFSLPSS